jgi:predicted outer membrane repeat protein
MCLALLLACSSDDETAPAAPVPVGPVIEVPGEAATIAAAIAAADSGDTILLADGIYEGEGNRDLYLGGKSLVLCSEYGPDSCILDLGGSAAEPHFGIKLVNDEEDVVIDGLTIRNGYTNHGAAIEMYSVSAEIRNCVFARNHATVSGGAVRCKSSPAVFRHCTFVGNSTAMSGGALYFIANPGASLIGCVIAFCPEGEAIYARDASSAPILACCNLYGNDGGDWVSRIEGQRNLDDNFSSDPLFCDTLAGDFRVAPQSPCVEAQSPCGERVGALGPGCD